MYWIRLWGSQHLYYLNFFLPLKDQLVFVCINVMWFFLTFQDSLAGTASCVIWRQCIKKRSEFNVQAIDWRMIIFSKSNKVEIKVYQFVVEFEPHTKKTRYYTTIATMIIAKCPFSLNLSKAEKKNKPFQLQFPWFRGFLIRTVHNLLLYLEEAYQPSLVKVVSKKLKSKLMFQTGVVGFSSLPLPIDWNRKVKGNHYKWLLFSINMLLGFYT